MCAMKTSELDQRFAQLGEFKCRLRAQARWGSVETCPCGPGNRVCDYALHQKPRVTVHRLTASGPVRMGRHWTK